MHTHFFSVHLRKVWFYDSFGLLKTLLVPRILQHLMEASDSGLLCIETGTQFLQVRCNFTWPVMAAGHKQTWARYPGCQMDFYGR